ncbi:hypothetical protein BOO86_00750 [Mycobacterium sp. CBMA 234]|uniref:SDR family NAD(P)-dependent oxidoreductase n=1 Tax=Mycolicibacterium sp. CBMA 234 TaxID=1918495 RepID=UPI00139134C1|nr:SDR family NAD(P)-dependent oxidoreductase [Mycolicibacterium sp. CBMA 234]MUL62976.1 hypothetical protein [Mycolicibacterium sp. CBMA 234]
MKSLDGQVILITGAAGGIGAATARKLAASGARPVLADLDADALERAAATIEPVPLTVQIDVTDPASCEAAVEATLHRHGRIDAVWANAGISAFGPVELLDDATWRRVVEVNLIGAYNIIRAALPSVVGQRGYITMTASWASFAHSPGHSAYSASKAGLEALANSLRSELSYTGTRVGVFHPGWIDTPMVADKRDHNAAFNAMFESLPAPLRTLSTPEEIADHLVVAFERRTPKVVYPKLGWALHLLRPLLPTRLVTAGARRVAPDARRLFLIDDARRGPVLGSRCVNPTSG